MKFLYTIIFLLVIITNSFPQFYFISEDVGWFGNLSKQLYKTTDGCKTWSIQNIDSISFSRVIQFMDDSSGFFHTTGKGYSNLYKTTNQGNNWELINRKSGFYPRFLDKYNGYSIGSSDSFYLESSTSTDTFWYQRLLKTTNGGITWDSLSFIDADKNHVIRVWVHSATIINLVMNASLYKTTNAGQSWFKQTTPIKVANFWYIDSLEGFIWLHSLYKTTDGGITWSEKNSNALKIVFSDSTTLFGSLYNTYLFKSTNRGETWFELRGIETSDETYNYYFLNKDFGFAIQYSGGIAKFYRTTDGGYTWTFVGSIPNTATNQEENNILYYFSLEQNYPNPFNPSTKINYTLPKQGLVTIKVYDVLGKEIMQLVNEEKPSGEYEVEFDGSSLSSGIYYYKIQAGEFVQTKKMVLMK
ncbi:MAG TPA: T9SS type A sorting domain-containing protein [Ignavibacteriaceae bacterium]|nr:T9SS type A sorting domain-containing protein [Ignavibacteriaceae bacterium]